MPYGDGIITEADVRAAQTALDLVMQSLQEDPRRLDGDETPAQLLEVFLPFRGILAGQFADMRVAGYLQGVQDGRQQVGGLLRRALEEIVAGEGL